MSIEAVGWALKQKLDKSSAKFVLVAMANCADGQTWNCWPSVAYLCEATCQDRKTVIENIKRLKAAGFISETGSKKGETGQISVYKLNETPVQNNTENGTVKESQKRNGSEKGTVPKTDAKSPVFPSKESRFSAKESQKRDTEPSEPSEEPSREPSVSADAPKTSENATGSLTQRDLVKQHGVDEQVARDFMAIRKAKRAPLTPTALSGIEREAHAAGLALSDAIRICAENGWQGFKRAWYENLRRPAAGSQRTGTVDRSDENRRAIAEAKVILFGEQARAAS